METERIDVVILCGGMGKRLKTVVGGQPKSMAEIKDKPFLDILIDYVTSFGFKRFILCTGSGYLGNVIKEYFQKKKKILWRFSFPRRKSPWKQREQQKMQNLLSRTPPFWL